jgi:hypothetical protein
MGAINRAFITIHPTFNTEPSLVLNKQETARMNSAGRITIARKRIE